jgi:uncharacterized repeat protein (TIGR01451 family)
LSPTSIRLTWNANGESDFDLYELDFSSYSDSAGWQDLISSNVVTCDHTGLDIGNTYYYRIKAWDVSGLTSDWASVASTTTGSGGPAEISVSKSTSTSSAKPGESITYTITYANNGGAAATNLVITDSVPLNTTLNGDATAPNGETVEYYYSSAWSGTSDPSAEKIRWTRGSLNAGVTNQQVQFTVDVR